MSPLTFLPGFLCCRSQWLKMGSDGRIVPLHSSWSTCKPRERSDRQTSQSLRFALPIVLPLTNLKWCMTIHYRTPSSSYSVFCKSHSLFICYCYHHCVIKPQVCTPLPKWSHWPAKLNGGDLTQHYLHLHSLPSQNNRDLCKSTFPRDQDRKQKVSSSNIYISLFHFCWSDPKSHTETVIDVSKVSNHLTLGFSFPTKSWECAIQPIELLE